MLQSLTNALWNPPLLALFLFTGGLCTLLSGCFQLRHAPLWWRSTLGSGRRGSCSPQGLPPLRVLATALASTLGTGSIAGVATAIWLGGPGAVFWMWISALLGMMTSCFEKLLTVQYRQPNPKGGWLGGAMYYLRDGVGSPFLATWFALACLPATLAGGNLVQSRSISATLSTTLGLPPLWIGLFTALLAGLVMVGGIGGISRVSAALVPLMALLYLGGGLLCLVCRSAYILPALSTIFSCALRPQSVVAGGCGYTLSAALRYGVSRGVFTNEAGLGTSAMAHATAQVDHPAQQGMWGILEVFCSTLVVCTVTALVILTSGVYQPAQALGSIASGTISPTQLGAPLTAAAFSVSLGGLGAGIVSLSLLLFAFTSILGWSYYGSQALSFLTHAPLPHLLYRGVFLCLIVVGGVSDTASVWLLVDFCNALMAIPNLFALLFLAPAALKSLRQWQISPHLKK